MGYKDLKRIDSWPQGKKAFCFIFFFFKQKTAYEIGTGDWSSDVCSSDLPQGDPGSKKFMALLVSIKSGGAAATRNGQYKKRGRSRMEIRAVKI